MAVDNNGMHTDKHGVKYSVFGFGEFINYAMTKPISKECKKQSSLRTYNESEENPWAGTHNWETAVGYAQHGWDAGLRDLAEYVETNSTLINVEHDIVGHAVDVGRFLTGVPDSMVSFYDDSYRNKAPLTVYTKLTYLSDIKGEQAMEYCGKILETIGILSRTFNIKLVGVFDSINNGKTNMVLVNIKDTDEHFVMNNLAFAYHPAFFRRFWFKWLETTDMWSSGYGTCPRGTFGSNKLAKSLLEVVPPNEQVIFMPDVYHREDIDPVEIAKKAVEEQQSKMR